MDMRTFRPTEEQLIVTELKKQYEVVDVDSNSEIDKDAIDVLVVVQPSSLSPTQLPHVLDAIRAGVPTAIFEDPSPLRFQGQVPGTDEPKRSPASMFGMGGGPQPKCEVGQLWDLLGLHLVKAKRGSVQQGQDAIRRDIDKGSVEVQVRWEPFTPIVWQHYNPYRQNPSIQDAVVFVTPDAETDPLAREKAETFNPEQPAVSGLHEVLFLAPGAFEEARHKSDAAQGLSFIPLATTSDNAGLQDDLRRNVEPPGIRATKTQKDDQSDEQWMDIVQATKPLGDPRLHTHQRYVLAARVTGALDSAPPADAASDESGDKAEKDDAKAKDKPAKSSDKPQIDVILVSDIDMLESLFVTLHNEPDQGGVVYKFQNVPFVLNLIDTLSGDERFINIRKRTRHHASLKLIEERVREAEEASETEEEAYRKTLEKELRDAQAKHQSILQSINQKKLAEQRAGKLTREREDELDSKLEWEQDRNRERLEDVAGQHRRKLGEKQLEIARNLELQRRSIQNQYKTWAVVLPTIPPLLVGLAVFLLRRVRESQGVAQARRR
ncbi:MAG: hypothetical protein KDA41_17590, partial [Planctomycetales bacterium]|nr:hypothetical protein [Planctomycetales bacterium]